MKSLIEIAAAALLIVCIAGPGVALAGPAADGVTCSFSAPKAASSAARCAAIKRQCELLWRQVAVGREMRQRSLPETLCHAAAIKSA